MTPVRIAILASGSGSNAENIVRYFSDDERVHFEVILSNKSDAYVHERARKLGIPSLYLPKEVMTNGLELLRVMQEHRIDFVVLAGYLLLIPQELIAAYPNRIVNIHPALLPRFGGKGMYGDRVHRAVVEAGVSESGITIHWVNEHYDEGAVVFQATCPVAPNDTPDAVAQKVHALEYAHFPAVLEQVLSKEFGW
jgi:phosphoribosylglycinamide formyltransferase-1